MSLTQWSTDFDDDSEESSPHHDRDDLAQVEPSVSPMTVAVSWPRPLDQAAMHGLVGEFVSLIHPHTEADPVAVLIQLLAASGNVIGRTAHSRVESTDHYLNLFVVLVGETSRSRKGTSWAHVQSAYRQIDRDWTNDHITTGLSSGEGLIHAVRDPTFKADGDLLDPGVDDKRLLVVESEFASTLKNMNRDGNILSPVLRNAFDGDDVLQTLTKNSPAKATNAHISVIGHITKDEAARYLTKTEMGNGFANRFLWAAVKRHQLLPDGSDFDRGALQPVIERLGKAVANARTMGEVKRDDGAAQMWRDRYPDLTRDRFGLVGAITSRAEAQVMRLACLYACLDQSYVVKEEHLSAALALWSYCEQSVEYVFGDATGDEVADKILKALVNQPQGLTRTEIRDLFGRNLWAGTINRALDVLVKQGRATHTTNPLTGGRAADVWTFANGQETPNQ
jgi:hypothetical protein